VTFSLLTYVAIWEPLNYPCHTETANSAGTIRRGSGRKPSWHSLRRIEQNLEKTSRIVGPRSGFDQSGRVTDELTCLGNLTVAQK